MSSSMKRSRTSNEIDPPLCSLISAFSCCQKFYAVKSEDHCKDTRSVVRTIFVICHQLVFRIGQNVFPTERYFFTDTFCQTNRYGTYAILCDCKSDLRHCWLFEASFWRVWGLSWNCSKKCEVHIPRMTTILHKQSVLFSRREILVPEFAEIKINVQMHSFSSQVHWICLADFAMTNHIRSGLVANHGRSTDK